LSPAKQAEQFAAMKETYAMFQSYGRDGREGQDLISYDIFDYFFGQMVEGERWQHHGYPVNQMFGVHTRFPQFMTDMHQVGDATDAEYYVQRLNGVGVQFAGLLASLKQSEAAGVVPPRFVIEAV